MYIHTYKHTHMESPITPNIVDISSNRKSKIITHVLVVYSPVEGVSIVGDYDVWFDIQNVVEELPQEGGLIWLVKNDERTLVLWLRGVLKVLHVGSNHLSIRDKVALEWNGNGKWGTRNELR